MQMRHTRLQGHGGRNSSIKCGHKIASITQTWHTTAGHRGRNSANLFLSTFLLFLVFLLFLFLFFHQTFLFSCFLFFYPIKYLKNGISMTADLKPIKRWKSNRDWRHRTIWEAEAGESQLAHRVSLSLIWVGGCYTVQKDLFALSVRGPGSETQHWVENRDNISTQSLGLDSVIYRMESLWEDVRNGGSPRTTAIALPFFFFLNKKYLSFFCLVCLVHICREAN